MSVCRGAGRRTRQRPGLLQVLRFCPREAFTKEKSLQTDAVSHRLEPALPLSYVKAKQRELLPEKTRAVKRMKEVIYVWNIVSHDMNEINTGPQYFLSFPPPHNSLSWQNECIPPTHTSPAWPTDLGPSLFSSPVILSSCERAQIHL